MTKEYKERITKGPLCSFEPNIDFIIVQRMDEVESDVIVKPDAYKQPGDRALVLNVGKGRIVGNTIMPMEYFPGDVVAISKYGTEWKIKEFEKPCTILRVGDVYGRDNEASRT
jgi:co-chaperonin GroES (HSP10)